MPNQNPPQPGGKKTGIGEKIKDMLEQHPILVASILGGAGLAIFMIMRGNSSSSANSATGVPTDAAGNPLTGGYTVSPTLSNTDLSTQLQDMEQQILNWEAQFTGTSGNNGNGNQPPPASPVPNPSSGNGSSPIPPQPSPPTNPIVPPASPFGNPFTVVTGNGGQNPPGASPIPQFIRNALGQGQNMLNGGGAPTGVPSGPTVVNGVGTIVGQAISGLLSIINVPPASPIPQPHGGPIPPIPPASPIRHTPLGPSAPLPMHNPSVLNIFR